MPLVLTRRQRATRPQLQPGTSSNLCGSVERADAMTQRFVLWRAAVVTLMLSIGAPLMHGQAPQVAVGGVQTNLAGPWSQSGTGPVGVATDSAGNIYIGQHLAQSIIRIDAHTHATSTFASSCGQTPLGRIQYLAMSANDTLYVADGTNSAVFGFSVATGACVATYPATGNAPFGVALDSSGNLYFTTFPLTNGVVGVFEVPAGAPSGTQPTALITTGIQYATGIAFDPTSGDMLVGDQAAGNVWKYTVASGFNASSQTAYLTGLNEPYGIFFDANKNLLVSESGANTVLRYSYPGYSSPVQMTPYIESATGIGEDPAGNIYVAGYTGNTVSEFNSSFGQVALGSTSHSLAVNFQVAASTNIGGFRYSGEGIVGQEFAQVAPDSNSNLCTTGSYASGRVCAVDVLFTPIASGTRAGAVDVLDVNNNVLATAYLQGTGTAAQVNFLPGVQQLIDNSVTAPQGIAVDGAGNVYVADTFGNRVLKETLSSTGYVQSVVPTSTLANPVGIGIDGAGNLYIVDEGHERVLKETPAAQPFAESVVSTSALLGPLGMVVDGGGNLYIADAGNNRILRESPTGQGGYTESVVVSSSGLSGTQGVDVDAAGNVYIADTANARALLETLQPGGSYVETVIDSTSFSSPDGIRVDENGNVYVADQGNGKVFKETLANGVYTPTVVALSGINSPQGLAIDANGNLYVSDQGTNQALKLDFSDAPALTFPSTEIGVTSVAQDITLENAGNAALLLPAGNAGSNPQVSANFALDASEAGACSGLANGSLAPNGQCGLSTSFAPQTTGTINGSLILTDNNLSSASTATQTVNLSGTGLATTASMVVLSGLQASVAAGGNLGTLTAKIEDTNGNVLTGSSASLTATITGPDGYSQVITATAVHGVATFNLGALVLTKAGVYSVTVTSPGVTTASANVAVVAGPAAKLAVSAITSPIADGGNAGAVTATVEDAYGNVVSNASVPVTVTITGPNGYAKTVTATSVGGVATLNLNSFVFEAAGTYTLTTSSPGITPAVSTITVVAGGLPATIAVSSIPTTVANGGNLGTIAATLKDSAGNTVTVGAVTMTAVLTGPGGYLKTVTAATVNGVASLNLTELALTTPGSYTLSISSPGLPAVSFTFTVTQGFVLASTAGATPTQTVALGAAGTFTFTLTPDSGGYTQPITLSASGLPPASRYSFSPAMITPGVKAATTTLTIQTALATARLEQDFPARRLEKGAAALALGFLLLPFAGSRRWRKAARKLPFAGLMLILVSAGAVCGLAGCNGSPKSFAPAQTSYAITVTATSGSLVQSTKVTLVVE